MDAINHQIIALVQVIMIDITLAADNAIVVGLAAARVAPENKAKVIFWGIAGAVVLRVLFATVTLQLMAIVGLTLAGGILLLWVCWKIARELWPGRKATTDAAAGARAAQPMSLRAAVLQIVVADVSMSLDNVLAVAGAAKGHLVVLVAGLVFSIALMAVAARRHQVLADLDGRGAGRHCRRLAGLRIGISRQRLRLGRSAVGQQSPRRVARQCVDRPLGHARRLFRPLLRAASRRRADRGRHL